MIKETIKFKTSDFSQNGIIKNSAVLTYMQEAALSDANKYMATRENLLSDNMYFVVYRNILNFKQKVDNNTKELVLLTFQSSHDRMRFIRSYFMYIPGTEPDLDGDFDPYENAVIYCDSIWALVDLEKRTLLKTSELKYPVEEIPLPFDRHPKILIDKEIASKEGTFVGKDYYIDSNGHVNNASYADIIDNFSNSKDAIKHLDITYEHEILSDDVIEVFAEKTAEGTKLTGIRTSDLVSCFSSEIR